MNDVSAISRLPVQPVEPDLDASTDELNDSLVPVEEDELPQGVLDLLATLIWRHRPMARTGSSAPPPSTASAKGDGAEIPVSQPKDQSTAQYQRPASLFDTPQQRPALWSGTPQQRPALLSDTPQQRPAALSGTPLQQPVQPRVALEIAVIEAAVQATGPDAQPLVSDGPSSADETAKPMSDPELRAGLPVAAIMRNIPAVVLPVAAPPQASPSLPPPEVALEEVAVSSRDFLQIPFSKGAASGQVTVTRIPGESAQNLLLSPSSAQVFDHLKEPFEQVRDPYWRLTDHGDEPHQQPDGRHQSPDDEQAEHQERPA
ncbi:hypothetical protein HK44_022805 [Pseudomonas fluorescens HK44]|uniref:Surface presentation of antigen domain-containing protein n=1 Tax=Pseudomonas fluorescens HK44 TaxID=1042209 RepID=A0A010RVU2_PSEFL|nr:hypothetical protein [Pseudomonas fluorescens]EXF96346.1 hypothetical protein HK44_022805 [Pseudomonas fluorescens HK44]